MATQSRSERQNLNVPTMTLLAEVARQGAEPKDEGKDEVKLPVFWKLFGGTVLSITAMVVVTAYQSLSSNAAEVRSDVAALNNEVRKELGRLSEAQGELVKKDECDSRFKSVWRDMAELQEDRKELIKLRETCEKLMEKRRRSDEEGRKLAQDLQALREERVRQRERQALREELAALRERLAGLEGKKAAPAAPASKPAGKVGRLQKALDTVRGAVAKAIDGTTSSDPNRRIELLLRQSEDLRQIEQEWMRSWLPDQPSRVTYDRVHGGLSPE